MGEATYLGMDLGFSRPMSYAGLDVTLLSAEQQMRTPRDVPVGWVRPRCPPKRDGRRGTRRAWKQRRANWPHMEFTFREPTDVLQIGRRIIATEKQWNVLREILQKKATP